MELFILHQNEIVTNFTDDVEVNYDLMTGKLNYKIKTRGQTGQTVQNCQAGQFLTVSNSIDMNSKSLNCDPTKPQSVSGVIVDPTKPIVVSGVIVDPQINKDVMSTVPKIFTLEIMFRDSSTINVYNKFVEYFSAFVDGELITKPPVYTKKKVLLDKFQLLHDEINKYNEEFKDNKIDMPNGIYKEVGLYLGGRITFSCHHLTSAYSKMLLAGIIGRFM